MGPCEGHPTKNQRSSDTVPTVPPDPSELRSRLAAGEPAADAPVDLARVGRAVRRHAALVAASVCLVVAVVYAASVRAPKRYEATARIAAQAGTGAATNDPTTVTTGLATSRALLIGPAVLGPAAKRIPGMTEDQLAASVTGAVEPDASILDVSVADTDPQRAALAASTVATTFLAQRTRDQRAAAGRAKARLEAQLATVKGDTTPGGLANALRVRISDLAATQASAGTDLVLAETAAVPTVPVAPRPARNALFAGLAALLLAVVAAVIRDRSGRRSVEAHELAVQAGLSLLAVVPDGRVSGLRRLRTLVGRRSGGDRAIVEQAALQAAVRTALPPRPARTLLVCGIAGREGAARLARGLARSLSWSGQEALLVDSAARGPTDDALAEARRTAHRYLIVSTPVADGSSSLPLLAWQADAAILVGRLGRTTPGAVRTAMQVLGALDVHVLGLALTASPADAAAIREVGFDAPVAPPARRIRARQTAG